MSVGGGTVCKNTISIISSVLTVTTRSYSELLNVSTAMVIKIQVFWTAIKWQLANSLGHNRSLLKVEALRSFATILRTNSSRSVTFWKTRVFCRLFVIQYCESQNKWSFQ